MKKKILYFSSLTILSFFMLFIIYANNTYSKFDSSNVIDTISTLSSRTFGGRLSGTTENSFTSEYIKNKYMKYGLLPYNNSYIQDFNIICPTPIDSSPYLKIYNNGQIEEELKYGIDFKEDMINFKNNSFSFSNDDNVTILKSNIQISCSNGNFLLFIPTDNNLNVRSSFSNNFIFDSIIMITSDTYDKIVSSLKDNKTISIHVPFTNEEKNISNVVAMIKGSKPSLAPLIITAHFDHLGTDGAGNTYGGSLDNASGTAFILELARSLSTFAKPERDIIFVSLNAEELGLLGSKDFAKKNISYIKNSEVINFDMIGSPNTPISFMQGTSYKDKDSSLLKSLEEICKEEGVSYNILYQDSSDHASFNNMSIDAVSFCHSDLSKIHTPNDTIDYIDSDAIDAVSKVVYSKIKSSCYNSLTLLIYNPIIIIIISIILGFLLAYGVLSKNNKIMCDNGYKIFSLLGIVITILSFILYLKGYRDSIILMLIFLFSNIIYMYKNKIAH